MAYDELSPHPLWLAWKESSEEKTPSLRLAKYEYNLIAQLYRRLQANYIRNFQYAEAGDFYIGEQEMVRKGKGRFRRFFCANFLYKIASMYGESFWMPLGWLVAFLLFFPALLLWDGVFLYGKPEVNYAWSWWPTDIFFAKADYWECFFRNLSVCSLNRSAMNDMITSSHQIGLFTLESILIVTFVTLFVLALRRRFKRKSF